jgi:putative membrane protein
VGTNNKNPGDKSNKPAGYPKSGKLKMNVFIDYVSLMLINMAGGLVILASFIWKDIDREYNRFWSPAFALPGMIAVTCGFAMIFSWPLPNPYNIAYGETSVLLGFLFLAAALSIAKGWQLYPLGIYAFFAGLAGVIVGIRIINLGLTLTPIISGIGFILTGSGGIFAEIVILNHDKKWLRIIGALVLIAAAIIWALTAYYEYWAHLQIKGN